MRAAGLALACVAAACAASTLATLPDPFAGVAGAYLVTIDDREHWGHAPDAALPPASLTKMMSALLVAESIGRRGDADVAVSPRAARSAGARLGLRAGDAMRASALLEAMLMHSANDACVALAEWRDGSEAAFVLSMNAEARRLGLASTHFDNACGFDASGQRMSARDALTLAKRVLATPELAAIVRQTRGTISTLDGRRFTFVNSNALIGRVDGVIGVKTGFTARAGRCVVAAAERGGTRVVVVLMGAGDRWWDAVAMLERAFVDAGSVAARR